MNLLEFLSLLPLFTFAFSLFLFLCLGGWMRNSYIIKWSEFWTLETKCTLFYFCQVFQTGQCSFMLRAQLAFQDRVGEVEVPLGFLVSLEEEHAASEVIVNCSRVDCITTERPLPDFLRLQEQSQGKCWLLHVIGNGSEAAVGEGKIGMVEWELYFLGSHVELEGEIVLTGTFIY